jgi:hypothetical protein
MKSCRLLITLLQLTNRSATATVQLPFFPLKQHFRFCCLKDSLLMATAHVAWAGTVKFCMQINFGRTVSYPLHATTNAPVLYYS